MVSGASSYKPSNSSGASREIPPCSLSERAGHVDSGMEHGVDTRQVSRFTTSKLKGMFVHTYFA